jgi:hypothetical protein
VAEESLRDYVVKLLFKTDKEGVEKAEGSIERIHKGIEALGKRMFVFNELVEGVSRAFEPFKQIAEFVSETAKEAAEMGILAQKTGIAAEELEQLHHIARASGVSADSMTSSMRLLQRQMGLAAAGSKEAQGHFAEVGVNIRGANGEVKSASELLPELSEKFQGMKSDAERTAKAMELFGRGGTEMIPVLKKSREEIEGLREELEALGGATTERFMESSEHYRQNVERLHLVWKGIKEAVAGPLVEAINRINDSFIAWMRVNGEIVRGKLFEWVQQGVDSFKALWHLGERIGGVMLLIGAAMNIPLIAAVALRLIVGLLIDDFAHWLDGNDSLIGRAVENWDEWLGELQKTHPILAKLANVFGKSVKFIYDTIQDVKKAWFDLEKNFEEIGFVESIKLALRGFGDMLKDFFLAPISDTISRAKDAIFDLLLKLKGMAKAVGLDSLAESFGGAAASVMRGGEGPRMRPSLASSSSTTNNVGGSPSMQTNVSVTAAPGMDEKKLAEHVAEKVAESQESMLRGAFDDLVPSAY